MLDADLTEQIAARFGLGAHPVSSHAPVARGEQGQVWRLDTDRGNWAVKEAFRRISASDVQQATEFAAAARAAGINTPLAVTDLDGNYLAELGGREIRVQEWVDLLAPDLRVDPAAVGRTLAGIHRTVFDGVSPLDEWFTQPVGAKGWDGLCQDLVDAGAPFAGQLALMRDELVALDGWVVPPVTVRTCHRDLWADNLRPTASGELCVIDWDDCGLADPGYELACLLVEFGGGDPARIQELYGAYLRHGGPGRVNRRGDFSMLICQLGHICAMSCQDWLNPAARSTDRQHSAERFAEFVDRPVNRTGVDLILTSLR